MLPFFKDQHVLVVHCRGIDGDSRDRSILVASPFCEEVCQIPSAHASSLLQKQLVCCGKKKDGGVSKNILWIYLAGRFAKNQTAALVDTFLGCESGFFN